MYLLVSQGSSLDTLIAARHDYEYALYSRSWPYMNATFTIGAELGLIGPNVYRLNQLLFI